VAVGVPIFHVRDGPVPTGTITVVGPRSRLPHQRLAAIGTQLVKIAHVFAAAP
jgi:DNA-binding IclR family transcriptional regulator